MKILITQPNDDYFIWQLRVQMMNFKEHGIEQDATILLGYRGTINPRALKFAESTTAEVIFYEDTRKSPIIYVPSIIPHLMAKYFATHDLDRFLYIGDDCLFVKRPEYPTDKKVYWAQGNSLSSVYIKTRSEALFYAMCNDAGIDPEVVEFNDPNLGGAQHLFNVVPDSSYWTEVEIVGDKLFKRVNEYNGIQTDRTKRVQAWTAGMWAIMWGLWKRKIETAQSKEMDHCWPSWPIVRLNDFNFFHNSGVTETSPKNLFFKGAHRFDIPGDLSHVSRDHCSGWYADQILKTNLKG